jgi:hypothetical protein
MPNTNERAPASGVSKSAIVPEEWELTPTYQQSLRRKADALQIAAEAMDIVLHGLDLDRRVFPDEASAADLRRRWAAQLLILQDAYRNVAVGIDTLRGAIAANDPTAS